MGAVLNPAFSDRLRFVFKPRPAFHVTPIIAVIIGAGLFLARGLREGAAFPLGGALTGGSAARVSDGDTATFPA